MFRMQRWKTLIFIIVIIIIIIIHIYRAYILDSQLQSNASTPQYCLNTVKDIEVFLNTIRGSEKRLRSSLLDVCIILS